MLTVSSLAAMHRVPLAGVNLGRLGFMTTCSVQELPLLAYALQEGSYLTDERSMLEVVRAGEDGVAAPPRKLALNEVSLIRAQSVAGKFPAHDAQRFPQSRFFRQRDQADYLGRIHAGDHTAFFRAAQLVNRNREKIVPPCSIP